MNTTRDDRTAGTSHPVRFMPGRSRRDSPPRRERPRHDRGRTRADDELFDDRVKPGRNRRERPRRDRRDEAFSDDPVEDRRKPKEGRRREPGYDRKSTHDRLRDYPRRHDWHDPDDVDDDDDLLEP